MILIKFQKPWKENIVTSILYLKMFTVILKNVTVYYIYIYLTICAT